jgi:leader peptidase (prepilin peptidase)/N-methyltransferase
VGVPSALLGGLFFGGILFLAALLSRGGMGGGDIKLAAMIGVFTGLQGSITAFVMSSLAGGLWALSLLITKKADRKTAIKFGPFLALGGWLAFLYGEIILGFYFHILSKTI